LKYDFVPTSKSSKNQVKEGEGNEESKKLQTIDLNVQMLGIPIFVQAQLQ